MGEHKRRLTERVAVLRRLVREGHELRKLMLMADPVQVNRVRRMQEGEDRLTQTFAHAARHHHAQIAKDTARLERMQRLLAHKERRFTRLTLLCNVMREFGEPRHPLCDARRADSVVEILEDSVVEVPE